MVPEDIAGYIEKLRVRGRELETALADPAIYAKTEECRRISREHRKLESLFEKFDAWTGALDQMAENREMLSGESDSELRDLISADIADLEAKAKQLEGEIQLSLLPPDPNDSKNIIVEIKPAAGGDEAALFAGELFRAYLKFAEKQHWHVEVLDQSDTDLGGIKDVSFSLSGEDVYSLMKYESGVHRVQRVPKTESQGRIQTSTATVAVLPEADEIDIHIDQSDLRIDTYCASGPGGQCVNTTYSAVRITHLPTNTVVQSQEQRSQIQNREVCMQMLRARLYEMELEKQQAELGAERQSQIGHGNRSEKIRTYNQPQDRVTDHRIGFNSTYNGVLLGDGLSSVIEALAAAERAEKLAQAV